MDPKVLLQAIVLIDTFVTRGPALLAALRVTLSTEDEAILRAEAQRLADQNDADAAATLAALDRLINAPGA